MSEPFDTEEKLEQLLERTLGALPPRRAPPTLQARVLDEWRRRAARPWWQRSFAHWPWLARGAFLLLSAAGIDLLLTTSRRAAEYLQSLPASSAWPLCWARAGAALFDPARDLLGALSQLSSLAWLNGAVGLAVAVYALLFGLGALAYRTLYLER
jgi:hypothetical protein